MEKRNCCVRGIKEGCQRPDRQDVVITLEGREVSRIPVYCFLEKMASVIEPDKDYETCLPGLRFFSGAGIAGRLDLDNFAKAGREIVAIKLARIFGGEIRDYFFPSDLDGRKVTYIGYLRDAFEEDEEEYPEELRKEVII